jgi:Mg-chelatase subunit ChlD
MPRNSAVQKRPLDQYAPVKCAKGDASLVPLRSTDIEVDIVGGLALVTTARVFENTSKASIEATMTFPVPIHAAFIGLEAEIDGRKLKGVAQRKKQARKSYEDAIDAGKTAILHEEVLHGVHMVSVGHIPAGKQVRILSTWVMPLFSQSSGDVALRIPTTVGDIYGQSPLPDSDDLVHGGSAQKATVKISCDGGTVRVVGGKPSKAGYTMLLDAPIDILVKNWSGTALRGIAADGRVVDIDIKQAPLQSTPVDMTILVDESGSMRERNSIDSPDSKFEAIRKAMVHGLQEALQDGDRIALWTFDNLARFIARGDKYEITQQANVMAFHNGGTEIGRSLATVMDDPNGQERDIIIMTDGQSHDLDIQALAKRGRRIHVLLIGESSLEARIGHLAALTGGQIFLCAGNDIDSALRNVLNAVRLPVENFSKVSKAGEMKQIRTIIGGMGIQITWSPAKEKIVGVQVPTMIEGQVSANEASKNALKPVSQAGNPKLARAVGALAASLALRYLDEEVAADLAEAEGLCGHLTSLVLVDDAGEIQDGIPTQHKVALMTPRTMNMAAPVHAGSSVTMYNDQAMRARSGGIMRSFATPLSARASLSSGSDRASFATGGMMFDASSERGLSDMSETYKRLTEKRNVQASMKIGSEFSMPRTAPAPTDKRASSALSVLAKSLDWDVAPDELRLGDLRSQKGIVRVILSDLAKRVDEWRPGHYTQDHRILCIIALLAKEKTPTNRNASRVYRAILKVLSSLSGLASPISEGVISEIEDFLQA